jgi:hypothetical protein
MGMCFAGAKKLALYCGDGVIDISFHAVDLAGGRFGDDLIVPYGFGHAEFTP